MNHSFLLKNKARAAGIFAVFAFLVLSQIFILAKTPEHKFHTTLTRLDYNKTEKILEVTIQMFPHDLEPLLEKRTGRKIDLQASPDIDKLIFEYLTENFVFKDKSGTARSPVWVGKELEVDTAYIYVQIPMDQDLEGASLQNTLFFESFPEQTNLVLARLEKRKADLLFVVGDKFKEISFDKSAIR